jgi:hypothetical protein
MKKKKILFILATAEDVVVKITATGIYNRNGW